MNEITIQEIEKVLSKFCDRPCTKIVKFMTDYEVPANTGRSISITECDGYRNINIFVRFDQEEHDEPPVNLGVVFALDRPFEMAARRYVNLEANLPSPQTTQFIEVSGRESWWGIQAKKSSYIARFPVMGSYVQVWVYNRAPKNRKVSVWAYLTS